MGLCCAQGMVAVKEPAFSKQALSNRVCVGVYQNQFHAVCWCVKPLPCMCWCVWNHLNIMFGVWNHVWGVHVGVWNHRCGCWCVKPPMQSGMCWCAEELWNHLHAMCSSSPIFWYSPHTHTHAHTHTITFLISHLIILFYHTVRNKHQILINIENVTFQTWLFWNQILAILQWNIFWIPPKQESE